MLRPRWHKVLTDIWGNKIRSLLVVASISVGLFALGLIANMYVIITEDMSVGYAAINPASIQLFTAPFDESLVDSLRQVSGAREVEGARLVSLRYKDRDGKWAQMDVKAIPDIEETLINRVSLQSGVWPPADRQLVVDQYKAGDLPGGIGEFIEIELPSGKIRKMQLVGIVHDQSIGATDSGGFFLSPVTGYITLETLAWLEFPETMNQLYITVDQNPNDLDHLRQVANLVSDEAEQSGTLVYSSAVRASDDHPNNVYVQAMSAVLFLLGFMVVFLSGFLITNTLQALLNQQEHQIGVMKTIGARREQIIGIYLVLIFAYGITAFLIAMPLASYGAYMLLTNLAQAVNMVLQGYRVIPLAVIIQLVVALIVPQAAGFLPILHGTSISAVEALNGYSQSNPPGRKGWIDHQLHKIRGLSRPLILSLRNTFRRKGRLLLTLVTLTLGGAIFIATFNVQRSLTSYIDRISRYFVADVNLSLKQNQRINEIERILLELPEVGAVEGWAAAAGELVMADGSAGESITLLAPPSTSELIEPTLLDGRWVQPGDFQAIVVNERFHESFPDLRVGDSMPVKIGGSETSLTVVGFFQMAGRSGGYLAYTTYEYLSVEINQVKKSSTYRITASQPDLTLEQQEALAQKIETHMRAYGYEVTETAAGHSLTATTADGMNVLTGFLLIMASLIAIVGSIGLTGTMSLNVLERTREIGIMRAIGASDRALMNQVIIEGMLIGLMSWIFGTLLSFPISTLLSNAINYSLFGAAAAFTFTPAGVLIWLAAVILLSIVASVMPARNAAQLTIREVLSYE